VSEHDERDDYDDEPWKGRPSPDRLVQWAARMVWALGLTQLGVTLVAAYFEAMRLLDRVDEAPLQQIEIEEFAAVLLLLTICVALNAVVIYGACRMRRFRHYGWAVTAAAINAVSIPFVPLLVVAAPVSIWALTLLTRRDVRARFAAVARGAASGGEFTAC
jgi:hypothetical protein